MTPEPTEEPADIFFARLSGAFVLRTLANASEVFEGDMMLGIVFMAIGQATVSHVAAERHLSEFEAGVAPDDMRHPVSVLSIAGSLNIPRETARRYVSRLIDLGYCQRVHGRRVIIPGEVYQRPELVQALHLNKRDLLLLLAAYRRAGAPKDDAI
ncbi:hypothetical protein GGQ61_002235 [Phenylobacterium haematophilum]|uniref:HTH iclR-type domain-containing protein n=1 Tax=Phenylobacterium haematophilum TaxID=98513 RepID=A0A840A2H3_9CAUL|nr:hypothetical protein [Phenylobacterium haematophilum]MBB3891507.1 hypothetical protein [Phenylobacterium haematophilum]